MIQVGTGSRIGRCLCGALLASLGIAVAVLTGAPGVYAADERAPGAHSEELNNLEEQMEELEAQLDTIYEKLTDYTVNSAPAEIVAERQRIEQELQTLHERRTQILRDASADSPTARRNLDAPAPPREPMRRKPLANSIVKIGNNLVVGMDEIVNGDVIIMGGNVRVEGEVLGDVIVLGGDLDITRTARIGGQALVVGGYLDEGRGATIEGGKLGLSFFPARGGLRGGWSRRATLLFDALQLLLLCGLAAWFLLIHRSRFRHAHEYLEGNRVRSFGLGVLVLTAGSFVLSVVAMLLLVTFIGIPVAGLLGMAAVTVLLAALFLGALQLGRRAQKAMHVSPGSRLLSACVGLLILLLPQVLGDVLHILSPWVEVTMDIVSAMLIVLALSLGLGAFVMTRMGRRSMVEDLGESATLPIPVPG